MAHTVLTTRPPVARPALVQARYLVQGALRAWQYAAAIAAYDCDGWEWRGRPLVAPA